MDAPDNPPALKKARKMGSDLFLVTAAGTTGHMKSLTRANPYIRADVAIGHLEVEVEHLDQGLKEHQAHYAALQQAVFPPDLSEVRGREEAIVDDDWPEPGYDKEGRSQARQELDRVYEVIQDADREVTNWRTELQFKKGCRAYLEQVRCMGDPERGLASIKELQAKRAKLRDGEVLPEDEAVAMAFEDRNMAQIQKYARGMIFRPAAARHRAAILRFVLQTQRIYRGHVGRRLAAVKFRRKWGATIIQAAWRGCKGRQSVRLVKLTRGKNYAAKPIQTFLRACLGRRRCKRRREFVRSSRLASAAVSHTGLIPDDLLELAARILRCLNNPNEAFPPPAVLGLLRLIAMLLETAGKPDVVTRYTQIGQRYQDIVATEELSWGNAMRFLRRTTKMFRKLRALAADPLRTPPRVMYIPQACLELSESLSKDPMFSDEALGKIGPGSLAAQSLLRYYRGLEYVYKVQNDFALDGMYAVPNWLKRIRALQKQIRGWNLKLQIRGTTALLAQQAMDARIEAGRRFGHEKEVQRVALDAVRSLEVSIKKVRMKLRVLETDFAVEDKYALEALVEQKLFLEMRLKAANQDRALVQAKADAGSRAARFLLRAMNEDCYRAEEAVRAKQYDVDIQAASNAVHAKMAEGSETFPEDITQDATEVGTYLCRVQVAQMYLDDHIADVGGKYYIAVLEGEEKAKYDLLHNELLEATAHRDAVEAKMNALTDAYEAEIDRVDIETVLTDIRTRKWDRTTQAQAQHEEQEDETCAKEEREILEEFLPREIRAQLAPDYEDPDRAAMVSSPVLLIMAKDTPQYVKQKVYSFLNSNFPDAFVHLGFQNLDNALDVGDYQAIIDQKRHVLAEFDIGLSYTARRHFLAAIFAVKFGLSRYPRVILVSGTSFDKRGVVSPLEP